MINDNECGQAWMKTRDFIVGQFSGLDTHLFYTIEGGFFVEWKSKPSQFCLRLWPPVEGQMTIEFHAVCEKEYYDWDIYPSNIERHFKNVVNKVLLHYRLR